MTQYLVGKWRSMLQRIPSPKFLGTPLIKWVCSPTLPHWGGAGLSARGVPRDRAAVLPPPGKLESDPRFGNPSIHLQQHQRTGDENGDPPDNIGRHDVEKPTPFWLLPDFRVRTPLVKGVPTPTLAPWGGAGRSTRVSCRSWERHSCAAPGKDRVSSLVHKYFHISTTANNRGQKQ